MKEIGRAIAPHGAFPEGVAISKGGAFNVDLLGVVDLSVQFEVSNIDTLKLTEQ